MNDSYVLGAIVGAAAAVVWALRQLADVVRAGIDLHMRTQVAIHKELCAMNDRFAPRDGAQPPPPPPDVQSRIDALRRAS